MNYPKNIEEKLGFDLIRHKVSSYCYGPGGKALAQSASFSDKSAKVTLWLGQTREWLRLIQDAEPVPEGHYLDISKALKKLEIEGYFLLENELHDLRLVLRTIEGLLRFFSTRGESCPLISDLLKDLQSQKPAIQAIEKVLTEEGEMRSNASPELAQLNASISSIEKSLHRKAQQLYTKAKKEGWTADIELTLREGRMVIPVLAEHKRKIRGIVHDESATGAVLFIEPAEIVELNNELRELQIDRRKEIEKILRALSAQLAPYAASMEKGSKRISILDFIRAKAQFAHRYDAGIPEVKQKPQLNWKKAYHPLLLVHHREQHLPIIPLDLELNEEQRILVISGPNAGGKSVALKTVGLLQYMLQCGFPVTADERSEAGIFRQIFLDIGDDQSLDNDLSTYSSHLTNMKHFTSFSNGSTLVLIDEFGTGTDPQFGGPIAEAILEDLNSRRAYGVITTHYSNLKLLAGNTPGLLNGAMAYDARKLMPLYRLEPGKPGSSFAFEVAEKIGLNRKIIDRARKKVGSKQKNVDDLLVQLEKDRLGYEEKSKQAEETERHYDKLKSDYEQLKGGLETRRQEILLRAREEARQILKDSNALIERTVKEIREAGKGAPLKGRKEIERSREQLEKKISADKKKTEVSSEPLETGAQVRIKGQHSVGILVELGKNKAVVEFGQLRTSVSPDKLERVTRSQARELKKASEGYDINQTVSEMTFELDVRGKRGDEALKEVIQFLDKAIILGLNQIRILHGKGDGILRKLIRNELKSIPGVEKMEDEKVEFGGDGYTIVYLK